jgi:type VI secretion system protein ImpF
MNQKRVQDRLQPALIDRLTDDDPGNTSESPDMKVMSKNRMRDAVLRDLGWLFNSTQLSNDVLMDEFPEVKRSVLNYGLPAFSGQTASTVDPKVLESKVRAAIVTHEPRIIANTLKVEALLSAVQMDHHNQISFRISGQIWAQPVPLEMLVQTDIDLETGRVALKELSA